MNRTLIIAQLGYFPRVSSVHDLWYNLSLSDPVLVPGRGY